MIHPRELELIHGAIDGTHSTTEANEFDQLVNSNEEARALYASLSKLNGILDATPEVDVPGDLRSKILGAVEQSAGREHHREYDAGDVVPFQANARSKGAAASTAANPAGRKLGSWPGYAAAAAAGLLIGVLGLTWISENSDMDPADAIGTLAPRPDDSILIEGADPVEASAQGASGDLAVAIQLETIELGIHSLEDAFVVRVAGELAGWDALTLTFDSSRLQFEGIESEQSAPQVSGAQSGKLRIDLSGGVALDAMFSKRPAVPTTAPEAAASQSAHGGEQIVFELEHADGSGRKGTLILGR